VSKWTNCTALRMELQDTRNPRSGPTLEDGPTAKVHESSVGTYHPADPEEIPGWTVNDTRGYTDPGPSCDECGACECEKAADGTPLCQVADPEEWTDAPECIGLSFAFVGLDGGETLCEDCAEGVVEIVPCDCK